MQTKQMPVEKLPCSKPAEHFSSTVYSEKQAPTDWELALDLGNLYQESYNVCSHCDKILFFFILREAV